MPLIRPADADRVPRRALVLDLGDLRRHGEEVVSRAKAEAAAIAEEARAERVRIISGGREEGFAEGHAKGLAEGREQGRAEGHRQALAEIKARLAALDAGWTAALARFEAERAEITAAARESILALAADIAGRVTHRSIQLDPTIVKDQIESALAMTMHASRLVLRVHPDDRAIAEESLPAALRTLGGARDAEIEADDALARGSCIVRTEHGEVDASVGVQLERLIQTILPDRPAAKDPS